MAARCATNVAHGRPNVRGLAPAALIRRLALSYWNGLRMPDGRSLIVLFDADDLACVESVCPQALAGEVVAFQTEIHLLLEERGIRHTTPWTFVARDDRSRLDDLEAEILRHWRAYACIEFEGINLLNMAAFRHISAFARLTWAVFSIRRALERCRPACVYAFDEPPAHGLDQPPDYVKMPLLSGVVRGLAEEGRVDVHLIRRVGARKDSRTSDGKGARKDSRTSKEEGVRRDSRTSENAGAIFEDQVAKRSERVLEPVDVARALAGRPYILFNGNGAELLRQLPLIHAIRERLGLPCVQLYKEASEDQVRQLRDHGHHVWHESQVVRIDERPGIERISQQARTAFDTAGRETTGELGTIFNNPHLRCHFDFLFGPYARKMAGHVRAWRDFFGWQRPAAFVAHYHAPIFDVAAACGIPCLALPHGMIMQGLTTWFLTLPRDCLVGAISESHRRHLIAAGLCDDRIRVIGDPSNMATPTKHQGDSAGRRAGHARLPGAFRHPRRARPALRNWTILRDQPALRDDGQQTCQGKPARLDNGAELRRRYGIPAHQRIILLCTSSLGKPSHLPHVPITDWSEGVRNMFELARMAAGHEDWTLVVKQHPRYDHPSLYEAVNRTLPPDRCMVILSQCAQTRTDFRSHRPLPDGRGTDRRRCIAHGHLAEEPLRPLAEAADVVCIWNSVTSAILEASSAGKPVVVFSKAMIWYDRAAWGCQSWPHIEDFDRLEAELERLLGDRGYHAAQARRTREAAARYVEETAGPGVDRCVAVIEELLQKNGKPFAGEGARRDSRTSENVEYRDAFESRRPPRGAAATRRIGT